MTRRPKPLPCPICGNPPEVDRGLSDNPFPAGLEYVSCPTVFLNVGPDRFDATCGMHAQGIAVWNFKAMKARDTAASAGATT